MTIVTMPVERRQCFPGTQSVKETMTNVFLALKWQNITHRESDTCAMPALIWRDLLFVLCKLKNWTYALLTYQVPKATECLKNKIDYIFNKYIINNNNKLSFLKRLCVMTQCSNENVMQVSTMEWTQTWVAWVHWADKEEAWVTMDCTQDKIAFYNSRIIMPFLQTCFKSRKLQTTFGFSWCGLTKSHTSIYLMYFLQCCEVWIITKNIFLFVHIFQFCLMYSHNKIIL